MITVVIAGNGRLQRPPSTVASRVPMDEIEKITERSPAAQYLDALEKQRVKMGVEVGVNMARLLAAERYAADALIDRLDKGTAIIRKIKVDLVAARDAAAKLIIALDKFILAVESM